MGLDQREPYRIRATELSDRTVCTSINNIRRFITHSIMGSPKQGSDADRDWNIGWLYQTEG